MTTQEILEAARAAKQAVALASSRTRQSVLARMADALRAPDSVEAILAANAEDMAAAKGHISDVMLDRLALTPERIGAMAKGILEVAALPDPVGAVLNRVERPNGLVIEKTAVPMGVIAIIYESRPNVTLALRQASLPQPRMQALPPLPSRAATPASCAAARRPGGAPAPSSPHCAGACGRTACPKPPSLSLRTPPTPPPTP